MIRLRPYKKSDSKIICKWVDDEKAFMKWCAGRYEYPLTAQQLDERFENFSADGDKWFMTALDDSGKVCGHFIFRNADYEAGNVHMGFVIVAPECRGKGIGHQMMSQALRYAFDILGMKSVTLGVFANNPGALGCYKAAGFKETYTDRQCFEACGEVWDRIDMKAEKADS